MRDRNADLELGDDELDADASSGLVIDGEDDDRSSGLVASDDEDQDGAAADEPADEPADAAEPDVRFGDPLAISAADAQRIADRKLDTAKVLGLVSRDALPEVTDTEVKAQLARFHKKLASLEMQFGDLQKARGKVLGYRAWLEQLAQIARANDPARQLGALIRAEDRDAAIDELTTYIKFVLDDHYLEWAEHKKVLRKADHYGLTPADVEAIYLTFEPFDRETPTVAARTTGTGWSSHPRLATPGELDAWNLARLHEALLQQF
ncbi:MAG TPA: hypothetical protein VGC41_03155, partial [Kofleriaceae bacterium]